MRSSRSTVAWFVGITKPIRGVRFRSPLSGRRVGQPPHREGAARSPVHCSRAGGVLRNTNFRPRFFDPGAEKAGLSGLTPHELRQAEASLAIAAGVNVKAVQQILGHASAAMTLDIHAGLFANDLDVVADQLDRTFARTNADQMRTCGRLRDGLRRPASAFWGHVGGIPR
jgi:integrase